MNQHIMRYGGPDRFIGYLFRGQIYYGDRRPTIFYDTGCLYPTPLDTNKLLLDLGHLEGPMECCLNSQTKKAEPSLRFESIR